MLTIRLTRKGKKNQPFFRVVVTDKRNSSKGGRAVEDLGYVDPLTKKKNFKKERVLYWISKGAKPSPSIHNLLVSEKIIDAKKIHVSKLSTKKKAELEAAKKAATPAPAEAPATPAEPAPTEAPVEKPAETPKEPAQSPADNEADKEPKPETSAV